MIDPATALRDALHAAATVGGQVLRAAALAIATRPSAKPLHPRGGVVQGTLHRLGSPASSGVAWLDEAGDDPVLVRRSRAIGLPAPLPDVFGLAVRVPVGSGHGDLLLATTGLGRLTRFVLTVTRSPEGPLTTLMPYRTPSGPLLLSVTYDDPATLALAWAVGTGPWHRFARLHLHEDPDAQPDALVSFDPVLHAVPGLETYGWVRRLREPAYAAARRSRDVSPERAAGRPPGAPSEVGP